MLPKPITCQSPSSRVSDIRRPRRTSQIISASAKTSALQETAVESPCRPCRIRSTRSRRSFVVRAGCRSRWTGSPPSSGQALAVSDPHRRGFWPLLSTGTPDRLSKLTLPPLEIGKSAELSKKLVIDWFFWLCSNRLFFTLAEGRKMLVGFRRRPIPTSPSFVQTPL